MQSTDPTLITVRHSESPPSWIHTTLKGLRQQGWRLTYADVSRDSGERPVLWLHAHEPPSAFPTVLRPVFDQYALPNPWAALAAAAANRGDARLAVARRVHGVWHDVAGMQAFVDRSRPDRGLTAALPKMHHLIDAALRNPELGPPIDVRPPDGPVRQARQHARVVARWARQKAKKRNTVDQWQIGFRFGGDLADPSGFTWVDTPTDRFWADPIAFEYHGAHYVFYEEFVYPSGPGTLQVASVSREDGFQPLGSVLDTGMHLSFPYVFEHDGDLFLLPESVATGEVQLYRCTDFPHRWEPHAILAKRRMVDSVLLVHEGRFWLVGSEETVGAASGSDNLVAMHSDRLTGPYTAHPTPLLLDVRNARNAGGWMTQGDSWIRPAQDCSGRYGRALHIARVEALGETGLIESPMATIEPQEGELGRHTLHRAGDLVVTDRQVRVRLG